MQKLRDPRTRRFKKELHTDAFPRLLRADEKPKKNESVIDSTWSIAIENEAPNIIKNAAADLRRFFKEAMKVNLRAGAAKAIRVRVSNKGAPEGFSIATEKDGIDIDGNDARGAAQGAYYLERIMGLRGGPFVPQGRITKRPAFKRRINRSFYGKT